VVVSYPPFPGNEKNLLRSVIAHIVTSTSIAPDGFFSIDEEDISKVIKIPGPEIPLKDSSDLIDPISWKNYEIGINSIGRTTALPETEEKIMEKDFEVVEPLKSLSDIDGKSWTFRKFAFQDKLVVARNIEWPGAVTVVSGSRYVIVAKNNYERNKSIIHIYFCL
jgi:hypothetical protein